MDPIQIIRITILIAIRDAILIIIRNGTLITIRDAILIIICNATIIFICNAILLIVRNAAERCCKYVLARSAYRVNGVAPPTQYREEECKSKNPSCTTITEDEMDTVEDSRTEVPAKRTPKPPHSTAVTSQLTVSNSSTILSGEPTEATLARGEQFFTTAQYREECFACKDKGAFVEPHVPTMQELLNQFKSEGTPNKRNRSVDHTTNSRRSCDCVCYVE